MASEPIVKTSAKEIAYRSKYYHDIRAVEDTQLTCASCGENQNIQTQKVFSHPVLGILQCKKCWDHFEDIHFEVDNDDTTDRQYCYICGNNRSLYVCRQENCLYTFCKRCIRRNVTTPLSEIDDWKCFVCNSKPLWELRAVCALVMELFTKKSRKKTINKKEHTLPSTRRQLAKTRKVQKALKSLCDDEEDDSSAQRGSFLEFCRNGTRRSKQLYTLNSSEDSCDVENVEESKQKIEESDSDTDIEVRTKQQSLANGKRWSLKASNGIDKMKQKDRMINPLEDTTSDSEDERSISKRFMKANEAKDERKDIVSSEKKKKRMERASESDDSTNIDKNNKKQHTLDRRKQHLAEKRKTNEPKTKDTDSDSDEETETESKKKRLQKLKRFSTQNKEKTKKKARISDSENEQDASKNKKQHSASDVKKDSDDSSGKEFRTLKLSRKRRSMKHLNITKENIVERDKEKQTDKNQDKQFKSRIKKFLEDFKQICEESETRMEDIKDQYFNKDLSCHETAERLLCQFKNVVNKFKTELDKHEKGLANSYESCYTIRSPDSKGSSKQKQSKEKEPSSTERSHKVIRNKDERQKEKSKPSVEISEDETQDGVVSECDINMILSQSEESENESVKAQKEKRKPENISCEEVASEEEVSEHEKSLVLNKSDEEKETNLPSADETRAMSPNLASTIRQKKRRQLNKQSAKSEETKDSDKNPLQADEPVIDTSRTDEAPKASTDATESTDEISKPSDATNDDKKKNETNAPESKDPENENISDESEAERATLQLCEDQDNEEIVHSDETEKSTVKLSKDRTPSFGSSDNSDEESWSVKNFVVKDIDIEKIKETCMEISEMPVTDEVQNSRVNEKGETQVHSESTVSKLSSAIPENISTLNDTIDQSMTDIFESSFENEGEARDTSDSPLKTTTVSDKNTVIDESSDTGKSQDSVAAEPSNDKSVNRNKIKGTEEKTEDETETAAISSEKQESTDESGRKKDKNNIEDKVSEEPSTSEKLENEVDKKTDLEPEAQNKEDPPETSTSGQSNKKTTDKARKQGKARNKKQTVPDEQSECSSVSEVLDLEETAKKALLECDSSDSDAGSSNFKQPKKKTNMEEKKRDFLTVSTTSTSVSKKLGKENTSERKNRSKTRGKKQRGRNSSEEGNSSEELEECIKEALLNSDDSSSSSKTRASGKTKRGSDIDDGESVNARKALLASSSHGESSNSDQGSKSRKANADISRDKASRKSQLKRNCEMESDTSVGSRVKKRKLNLEKNSFYIMDKKLRMSCQVMVKRLPQEVLNKYRKALEKSRQHADQRLIKSLVNLDTLERSRRKDTDLSKSSGNRHRRKKSCAKEDDDSLLDHLKRVERGEVLDAIDEDSDNEDKQREQQMRPRPLTNDELISEADKAMKKSLLNSSGSSAEQEIGSDKSDEDASSSKKSKKELSRKKSQKSDQECTSDEEEANQKKEKSRWRRNKLLTKKILESDSDSEKEKWNKKQEKIKRQKEKENDEETNSDENSAMSQKKKKKPRRRIASSDSEMKLTDETNEDSDGSATDKSKHEKDSEDEDVPKNEKQKKLRKRNNRKSSDTDSSLGEKRPKTKRRRIKKMASDSDSEPTVASQGGSGKTGRKNIRKVLKDKQVAEDTKQAAKEEEERLKRIAERQKLYNEMYEMRLAAEEKVEELVLDFDTETKKEILSVHKDLVKHLKPHQARGIKFMWDACFESVERAKSTNGSGCIIAHCMGLGKTLQVIALVHTLLTHDDIGVNTVMIVCPLSTVLNWVNEFNTWLKDIDGVDLDIYELTKFKKNFERKFQLQEWQRTGGVLIIGYEMFRNLTGPCKGMRKAMKEAFLQCLLDPGPDLIVCDEGHLLKNEDTALSKCMKNVRTLRRIVLTGTPLQNNLIEYHCMVQFVKPNLLGTKKEFMNRFVNPITNGQFDNSTPYDVKLMKKRAHVLHKMLEGSVQRFDYSVLTPFLPPKQEYVIFVRLTDVQIKMYKHYLENFARRQQAVGGSVFADFQSLQRIWTHPIVLRLNAEKIEKANEKKCLSDSEGSLKDFIDDSSTETSTSSSENESDSDIEAIDDPQKSGLKRRTRNNPIEEPEPEEPEQSKEPEWWEQFVQPEHFEDMRISAKLVLLFGILKESEQIGDKVLVFSQSLYSLTLIEQFLEHIDSATQEGKTLDYLDGHTGSWCLGLDYFRLDGQTSAENRSIWCRLFNKPSNTRARLFLISTRAGGLGINLTAANRVIIFDASWNPSHDVQSIFRIYRFGQKKPCYVYRLLASGTMEEKIYNRQVTKLSLSCRVVDEQQIERHYSNNDLNELYKFELRPLEEKPTLNLPKDRLLAEIFLKYKDLVDTYHEHDSLLENKADEELDEEERKQAWLEYEEEKKGKPMLPVQATMQTFSNELLQHHLMRNPNALSQNILLQADYQNLQQLISKDYPNATPEQQKLMTQRALFEMYNYWEQQAVLQTNRNQMMPQNIQNPTSMLAPNKNPILLRPQQQMNYTQNVNRNAMSGSIVTNPFSYTAASANNVQSVDDDVVEVPANSTQSTITVPLHNSVPVSSKNQEE